MSRQAVVIVCDELMFSLSGKMTILGVYTTDIAIPTERYLVPQLAFLFMVEGDIEDPYKSLAFEIAFPGQPVHKQSFPQLLVPPTLPPNRLRWLARLPVLVRQPILMPGHIEAKIVHDQGEIIPQTPWIVISGRAPGQGAPGATNPSGDLH